MPGQKTLTGCAGVGPELRHRKPVPERERRPDGNGTAALERTNSKSTNYSESTALRQSDRICPALAGPSSKSELVSPPSAQRNGTRDRQSRMQLRNWNPCRRNSLRGFAAVSLPCGLEIDDIAIHTAGGRSWASLPARPILDSQGQPLRDERGKIRYASPIRWATYELGNEFGRRLVDLIRAAHPGALDDGNSSS